MTASDLRPLVAGNWKMNGLAASMAELEKIVKGAPALASGTDLMICPPATVIARFAAAARGTPVAIGGQDCHAEPSGAHTGDIAAEMLADAGARAVIVGHSERRADHHETDAEVRAKAQAAWRAGLTPTPADVAEVHKFIRSRLAARYGEAGAGIRILYGGSVKPSNAVELLAVPEVNGALVGGASLKAEDFLGIAAAYRRTGEGGKS